MQLLQRLSPRLQQGVLLKAKAALFASPFKTDLLGDALIFKYIYNQNFPYLTYLTYYSVV